VIRQVHYQNLLLLRSPSGPFFTFVIPLMLLVTLDLVYGDQLIPTRGGTPFPQFYLPSMMAFALVNACYINLINGTSLARDSGMLKRIRGTPLPGWAYLSGRVGSAATLGLASVVGVAVVGTTMFDADMVWATLPGTVLAVVTAACCFCALGLAVTPTVPSADAALPIAYGTFLPLSFISDIFFPSDSSPAWLRLTASVMPLRPLARSLEANLAPGATGWGFHWAELGVLVAWTAGAALALRWFRWEPSRPSSGHRGWLRSRAGR
jgi:ABC-type multidrug transport system permease subunit